ncbi:RagB/SusD family nutrient uptake outer membrane protein [Zhouia amylolytica]|uniref:RagB/SusD family nutrient uptake outer membrane protein n=1 Tax=Zhouia amylolytica TaxID=376730 RepID=UPI0020CF7154|nr:RagB/SusD family nutrient uptake outer membrane protein [Zhouia amylolytica]MCQ0112945.1 RagB/SusD family nutrient uptake outer membrane protein [Zhouia amylolytica]
MKSIRIVSFIASIMLLVGCNEDFLDRPDLDNITTDNYWQTPNDLNLFVIQFYTSFPGWSPGEWSGGIYWYDASSDNMLRTNVNNRLSGRNTINSGNGNWNYSNIRSVNTMLSKYQEIDAPFEEMSQYVGEGYFFRAYYYFNLVRSYGDVPWITDPLSPDSEELYSERTPRNEVINNILADLDKAIEYMPSGEVSNGNRLNKEIALLFKSRVALYEGTWEKYHSGTPFGVSGSDGTQFLQIAANTAKQLIDNPAGYGVYNTGATDNDYWVLFNQTDFSGHPEVMLWRAFDRDLGIAHNGQRYLPRIGGDVGLTKDLVDQYLCADGLPISLSGQYQGDQGLENVSANRDPRFAQTVYLPGDPMEEVNGEIITAFEQAPLGQSGSAGCPSGYMVFKGANPDPAQYSSGGVGTTSSPIFRFAEVLLNYAEAKAELGTITQTDIDMTINALRDRVGMPHLTLNSIPADPNWNFPGLSPIINEVRRERHVEFAAEGYRFDDIMRWQAADELIVNKRFKGVYFVQEDFPNLTPGVDVLVDADGYVDPHQNQIASGNQFNVNRDYLLPVPLNEITLNPKLEQNPGWE